jgi:hypoxanthine phosphoribosyltransferase
MSQVVINGLTFVPYIKEKEILRVTRSLANRINSDYGESEGIVVIGILNGAFMFCSDLVKELENVASVDFMKISSYKGTNSTGNVKIDLDLKINIEGKDVLIVEDIVDTGLSMNTLCKMLTTRSPNSINICTMLFKTETFNKNKQNHSNYPPEKVKYVCKEIKNKFVIGRGLDYNGKGRDLRDIYILKE